MNKILIKEDIKQYLITKAMSRRKQKALFYLIIRAIGATALAIIILIIGFF